MAQKYKVTLLVTIEADTKDKVTTLAADFGFDAMDLAGVTEVRGTLIEPRATG